MESLIRHRIQQCLIWVCTVCLCPTKRMLGLYGLKMNFEKHLKALLFFLLQSNMTNAKCICSIFCTLDMVVHLTLCIQETPKQVILQTVKTQMKCSMMLHFIRVYTVCEGKKNFRQKKTIFVFKL